MTGVILAVLAAAAVLLVVLAVRGRPGERFKAETLGAPPKERDDPLIRPDSRRGDLPGTSDIERHGGREHPGG